jgi:hypothetical protein
MLGFPFVKIVGQEDMKLALMLNVVDSRIGGVLIMGDRGTGKSVAVRGPRLPCALRPACRCPASGAGRCPVPRTSGGSGAARAAAVARAYRSFI